MSSYVFTAVTPSDTVALPKPARVFYIGVSGDVAVLGVNARNQIDTTPTVFKSVPAGLFTFPLYVSQIMATSTTATNIVEAIPPQDGLGLY